MSRRVFFEVARTLVAIGAAFVLALIIIYSVSDDPGFALYHFIVAPLTTTRYIGNILEMSIPLIFTGLAMSMMFTAKQFNLGAEGGFFIGAVAATAVAISFDMPPVILPFFAILAGGLAGGIGSTVPALLKAKLNASELVSSLMLNFILFWFGIFLINNYFRDEMAGAMASHRLNPDARLIRILPGTRLHFGIIIAILFIVLVYLFLFRTVGDMPLE